MKEILLNLIAIFTGGGIGAILRYCTTLSAIRLNASPLFATFFVNIIGCFIIGVFFAMNIYKFSLLSPAAKLFLTVGFLGALTTFSTFNLEIFELVKSGKALCGFSYMFLSCAIGFIATYLGYKLGIIIFTNH